MMDDGSDTRRTWRRCLGQGGITLVELLVTITILAIVGAMLTFTWVAMSSSFAHTTRSSDSRDYARQAMSRMEREIRDAEAQLTTGHYQGLPAILWASANRIMFVTTFNNEGNDVPDAQPLAIVYYLEDGTLYMKRDANDDGAWDGARTLSAVHDVVNASVGASGSTPTFSYTYLDGSGDLVVARDGDFIVLDPDSGEKGLPEGLRARIVSVTFSLLVDDNPRHPPAAVTLTTTAQVRNQRRF
jgi:type II secretory pathway pseudopilin PulG